ncbi:hypothetical protein AC788_20790 [Pseudomonas sp. RIT-PI-a]|nr:hypothetical protein AC788_20790 [Pseudomonas sp. RIT-PI-a]
MQSLWERVSAREEALTDNTFPTRIDAIPVGAGRAASPLPAKRPSLTTHSPGEPPCPTPP